MKIKHLLQLIFLGGIIYLDYLWYINIDKTGSIIWLTVNTLIGIILLFFFIGYILHNYKYKIMHFLNKKLF